MAFGGYAARVRDESLPRSHRLSALGSCLQHAPALEYLTAWSYLELRLGHARRDPGFPILAALAAVEDERRLRALAEAAHSTHRRAQKAAGQRHPRIAEVTPSSPRRWFGDEARAARHVLEAGTAVHELVTADVDPAARSAASDLLASGPRTDPARLAALQLLLTRSRRRRDHPTLLVLAQVHLATYGGLPIGVDWGFTPTGTV